MTDDPADTLALAETPAAPGQGRLAGKVALITGAAGNLGGAIVRAYLREGAMVVFSGRNQERLDAARAAALAGLNVPEAQADTLVMDGGDPAQVREGVARLLDAHGRLDILINNAGSAGPKQPIASIPMTRAELEALEGESETLGDALRNILGVTWNVSRAAAPHLTPGGSVINISTVFSRTPYYGRAAYVTPKAALNALSQAMAAELGPRGIRVNTIYPGPIESDRIRNAFKAMDSLRGDGQGATAATFTALMGLARSTDGGAPEPLFPRPDDIAETCVFLGGAESGALHAQALDVTHGMRVAIGSQSACIARPSLRVVDADGMTVLVAAGEQVEEALAIARAQARVGADVILGFTLEADVQAARSLMGRDEADARITARRVDRADPADLEQALAAGGRDGQEISSAIILPAYRAGRLTGPVLEASDDDVRVFLDHELGGAVALARALTRYWRGHKRLGHDPRFVFMSNGADAAGESYARCLAAAMEQLTRIWRDEMEVDVAHGRAPKAAWGNQVVRTTNAEPENLAFAAAQAASILFAERKIPEITLSLPVSIADSTGARRAIAGHTENLAGLHLGKVALITGGSRGIGGQIARLLALSGGKVMLTARGEDELRAMRAHIIAELEGVGYSGAERRVQTLAGVDVGDLRTLRRAVETTLEAYGRIDYLINNAGVAGAEQMVVDMELEDWRFTLDANLVSNYALMAEVTPLMKQQGSGYVVNVSSYFGGEKFLAVAYPNRADYAVSKAGQRAMVESLSEFLGPEIQLNAIAPGPVDGDRLQGVGGRPGLFQRRARLILLNRRLNAAHAAVVTAIRAGTAPTVALAHLARNDAAGLADDAAAPESLRAFAAACRREGADDCTWGDFILDDDIAWRLVRRLQAGGYVGEMALDGAPAEGRFLDPRDWRARAGASWLERRPPDDAPFLPAGEIDRQARKIGDSVLSLLHLGAMPTETEVALATVFFLADRAVTGETFMPSGGLNLERSVTERELFGSAKAERVASMRGKKVWLIGEHLAPHLAEAARTFIELGDAATVVFITRTAAAAQAMLAELDDLPDSKLQTYVCGGDLETAMDDALRQYGRPTTIVSTPFADLPDVLFGAPGRDRLDPAGFRELIEDNLTHHFRVARKAVLFDGAQLVLVAPDVREGARAPAFALANMIKTTLHAFTATIAVESERLVHDAPVNQINLTRRARSEEPRDAAERAEEIKRFARAVMLVGAPLPDAQDSRYRARIYRGTATTV